MSLRNDSLVLALLLVWPARGAAEKPLNVLEVETATVVATCQDIVASGKRHNSYWFTFRIDKVIDGRVEEKVLSSQELYHDFGGGQLLRMLGASGFYGEREKQHPPPAMENPQLILRLVKLPAKTGKARLDILWAARSGQENSMEKLEQLARALVKAVKTRDHALLRGRLSPDCGLTPKMLAELSDYDREEQWTEFGRLVFGSLLHQRDGQLYIGGGLYEYVLQLTRDDSTGDWVIRKVSRN